MVNLENFYRFIIHNYVIIPVSRYIIKPAYTALHVQEVYMKK